MDKNTYKILKFFNSHCTQLYSASTVYKMFPDFSPKDILEILHYLHNNGYLRIIRDNMYQSTNKGKTYKSVSRSNWISEHLVETIALIFSIASFCLSVFSIIYSVITRQSLMQ